MEKESILDEISKGILIGLKGILIVFFISSISISIFLEIVIIGKLYGSETAISILRFMKIYSQGFICFALVLILIAFVVSMLSSMNKSKEKFKEKRKEEFKEIIQEFIKNNSKKKNG